MTLKELNGPFLRWALGWGAVQLPLSNNPYEVLRLEIGGRTCVAYRSERSQGYVSGSNPEMAGLFESYKHKRALGPKPKRNFPKSLREALRIRDGNTCFYCGAPDPDSIEHLVALSVGGPNHEHNLVLACAPCNREADVLSVAEKVRLRERKLR